MGRSAESKLERAGRFDKLARGFAKSDPESAQALKEVARKDRKRAIKQLAKRPKRKKSADRLVI